MDRIRAFAPVAVAILAGAILGLVAIFEIDQWRSPDIVIVDPLPNAEIAVVIDGAVATPGMYRLPGDSRVADVLDAAGGGRPDANMAAVNLAERVRDSQQIVIPTVLPDLADLSEPGAATQDSTSAALGLATQPLNINLASAAELEALPGIGPALAESIIVRRDSLGPFESIDQLVEISGISERMVDELRPRISVE